MGVTEILAHIDREIAQLQKARTLLTGGALKSAAGAKKVTKKRNLTPEGRKRIAEAVKRRWARQKRAEKAAAAE